MNLIVFNVLTGPAGTFGHQNSQEVFILCKNRLELHPAHFNCGQVSLPATLFTMVTKSVESKKGELGEMNISKIKLKALELVKPNMCFQDDIM